MNCIKAIIIVSYPLMWSERFVWMSYTWSIKNLFYGESKHYNRKASKPQKSFYYNIVKKYAVSLLKSEKQSIDWTKWRKKTFECVVKNPACFIQKNDLEGEVSKNIQTCRHISETVWASLLGVCRLSKTLSFSHWFQKPQIRIWCYESIKVSLESWFQVYWDESRRLLGRNRVERAITNNSGRSAVCVYLSWIFSEVGRCRLVCWLGIWNVDSWRDFLNHCVVITAT